LLGRGIEGVDQTASGKQLGGRILVEGGGLKEENYFPGCSAGVPFVIARGPREGSAESHRPKSNPLEHQGGKRQPKRKERRTPSRKLRFVCWSGGKKVRRNCI